MPHVWLSNAPFAGWRRRCARPDALLFARATAAFVDRTPIDWSALLSRVRSSPERDLFDSLYGLAAVRNGVAQPCAEPAPRARAAAWTVVALGSLQTVLALVLVSTALIAGGSISGRAPQLLVAVAFAISSIRLAVANLDDERCLFLLATFTATASIFSRSAAGDLSPSWAAPLARLCGGVPLDALVPACFCQFALNFPRVFRFTRFDRLATPASATLWIFGTLTAGVHVIAADLGADVGPFKQLVRDDPSRLFWRLFSLALAAVVVVIAARARRAPRDERQRIARLAVAIVTSSLPFAAFAAVRTLVPAIDEWFRSAGAGALWLYSAIIMSLAATPVATVAAVAADRSAHQGAHGRRRLVPHLLPSTVAGRSDHDRIASALERLSRTGGVAARVTAFSREIGTLVGAYSVAIWLGDRHGRFVHWSNAAAYLPSTSGLVALLREADGPEDVSPGSAWFSLLPARDREWILAHEVNLIAALKDHVGLAAVVTIGGKHDGTAFDRRDHSVIKLLLAGTLVDGVDRAEGAARSETSSVAGCTGDAAAIECPGCGTVDFRLPFRCGCGVGAVPASLPPVVAGRFHVERRLGSGSMGVVYLAHDATLDRDVALKTTPALGACGISRLRKEAQAMAALNHEALATLYDLVIWRDSPVLVVEWLAGGTLAERLSGGPLAPDETVGIGIRLARALAYMHARAVVHRDLKPSNIGFTASGDAKLLDFGLATLAGTVRSSRDRSDVRTARARFAGTRAYTPPELLVGASSSAAADRWALAVVMLEALCGENPFAGSHRNGDRRSAPRHAALRSGHLCACPSLQAFLSRALAPAPAERFQTTGEFVRALESLAG